MLLGWSRMRPPHPRPALRQPCSLRALRLSHRPPALRLLMPESRLHDPARTTLTTKTKQIILTPGVQRGLIGGSGPAVAQRPRPTQFGFLAATAPGGSNSGLNRPQVLPQQQLEEADFRSSPQAAPSVRSDRPSAPAEATTLLPVMRRPSETAPPPPPPRPAISFQPAPQAVEEDIADDYEEYIDDTEAPVQRPPPPPPPSTLPPPPPLPPVSVTASRGPPRGAPPAPPLRQRRQVPLLSEL